jgi:histidyl-tRNA synthetase
VGLVLADRGLFPSDERVMELAGLRPDVYVLSNGTPQAEEQVKPIVATLRKQNVHARHTYKSTRNVGKLLQEAAGMKARVALIIESASHATLKDLTTGQQSAPMPLPHAMTLLTAPRP